MNNNTDRSDFIDIQGLLRQYLSKWYWFAISVVLCLGLAFAYIKIHKPVYQVNANLLITDNDDSGAMGGELGAFSGLFGGKNSVDDEALIVGSHTVLKSVAKQLGLNVQHIERTGFLGIIKTQLYSGEYPVTVIPAVKNISDTLRVSLRFKIRVDKEGHADITVKGNRKTLFEADNRQLPVTVTTPYGNFEVVKTAAYPKDKSVSMDINFNGYDMAAEGLSQFVAVDIVTKKANMIYLGYKTPYPYEGCRLLDEIMTQYNIRGIRDENIKGQKTLAFVDDRLQLLADELNDLQTEYTKYMQEQGIANISGTVKYAYEVKGQYESGLVYNQTQEEILKMMRDFLSDPDNAYSPIPGNLGSGTDLVVSEYNAQILKRMEMEPTVSPTNYAFKTLTDNIDATRKILLETIDKNIAQTQLTLKEIQASMNRNTNELSSIPEYELNVVKMTRERSTKELVYRFLLQQREESAMKIANALSKGTVIDEAYFLTEPLGMSNKMILALALLMGLMLPPILLYINQIVRGRFETKEEVEKYTSVPVLGEVCISRSIEPLVVKPDSEQTSESELFRLIRTNLQFMLRNSDDKVVLVTSTQSGEGKSFVSINLASSLSLLGKRTLLVGMDIRAGMLDKYLNLPPSRGLTEYLASPDVKLSDIVLHNPLSDNFDVIVAGPVPPNPSELLAGARVEQLFDELRKHYDYIIVDSAPVGMVSDTFVLARISDATIYVCRANYTPLRDIRFINSIYDQNRLKGMGLVVNGTKTRKGYGYGYGKSSSK